MQNYKTILIVIIVLLVGNIFFGVGYFLQSRALSKYDGAIQNQSINAKTLDFTKLFIEKVLKAEGEVSFETRLKLENAVRDLSDPAILSQWQKFVGSKTETEAQAETKNLLNVLVDKLRP